MTDLRKAAEAVLEAWGWDWSEPRNEALRERMEALRQALEQPDDFVYSEDKSYRVSPETGSFGIGDTPSKQGPEWIEDGFGTMWQKCGKKDCGKFVVKIGKVDCWNGDCPEAKKKDMKIYCELCKKVQPVRIDNCRDAKTNEPYQDIVCVECDFVIASGTGIAQPEQEPVAWMNNDYEVFFDAGKAACYSMGWIKPLYTAPPKREWKGLTSDDKHFLLANAWNKEQAFDGFMDAIDKFLEEKNT